ncbi:hypothetical protein DICPUDRAFT_148424 [Dictyostelium purpureum]|uniref:Uncharacterized protein n=1 Tax=Dictyostelium purpureum TaxID=5786 RepID=F0ZB35_DICPU|nr:uncharacterized protein DICPUDRAFT_148424 [Dictyostelium purpureum]EGC38849.1 hypothetical protein DICPUDRAFT_148424 [Dictyostelium purpureum]|eukprot:XP_003284643.1 hypothetical protein DICPUDRAFT_148424 [Dictyostelium purpureum]
MSNSEFELVLKKEFINFLTKVVKIMGDEVSHLEKEIIIQVSKIEATQNRMKLITQNIVFIETKRTKMEEVLGNLQASSEKEKSIIESLDREMDQLRGEAMRIESEIRAQRAAVDSFGPFKFLAEAAMALINELTGDLKNAYNRLEQYRDRYNQLGRYFQESMEKEREYSEAIRNIYEEKKKLDYEQNDCEMYIKELGRDKTKQEDFKLDLQQFKTKSQSLLDTLNLNLEFSDDMLNTKQELIKQIVDAYSSHKRVPPQELFEISSSTTVNSVYRISSL